MNRAILYQGTEGVSQVKVYIDEGAATVEVMQPLFLRILG